MEMVVYGMNTINVIVMPFFNLERKNIDSLLAQNVGNKQDFLPNGFQVPTPPPDWVENTKGTRGDHAWKRAQSLDQREGWGNPQSLSSAVKQTNHLLQHVLKQDKNQKKNIQVLRICFVQMHKRK